MSEEVVALVERVDTLRPAAAQRGGPLLPRLIVDAGPAAVGKFLEFFAVRIANRRTRAAYGRAVGQFLAWCEARGLALEAVSPLHVAAYIRTHPGSAPTVKQHLAAIRMLGDWLVVSQVLPVNPAAAVRGPKHVVTKGATPVLSPAEARRLLEAIDTGTLAGLRDRALVSVMLYSFARVSAVIGMRRQDYFRQESRGWLRLHEKGGKRHDVPAHHRAAEALDDYLEAAELDEAKAALFQSVDPAGRPLTGRPLSRRLVLAMIKRRAGGGWRCRCSTCCHTFRATGITAYLSNGIGTLEHAQRIAGHASPKTTKLYDRTAGHDHRRRDRAHRDRRRLVVLVASGLAGLAPERAVLAAAGGPAGSRLAKAYVWRPRCRPDRSGSCVGSLARRLAAAFFAIGLFGLLSRWSSGGTRGPSRPRLSIERSASRWRTSRSPIPAPSGWCWRTSMLELPSPAPSMATLESGENGGTGKFRTLVKLLSKMYEPEQCRPHPGRLARIVVTVLPGSLASQWRSPPRQRQHSRTSSASSCRPQQDASAVGDVAASRSSAPPADSRFGRAGASDVVHSTGRRASTRSSARARGRRSGPGR